MADPDRGFDAIVIGEYERAFYGAQYSQMTRLFEHYDIQLWTPEAGGRVDFQAEDQEQMMLKPDTATRPVFTESYRLRNHHPTAPCRSFFMRRRI
jgi:hypothetical protein